MQCLDGASATLRTFVPPMLSHPINEIYRTRHKSIIRLITSSKVFAHTSPRKCYYIFIIQMRKYNQHKLHLLFTFIWYWITINYNNPISESSWNWASICGAGHLRLHSHILVLTVIT